ncbi:myosin-14-like isoform X5 [Corvus kubaryi]|uniref:myosin-14-like isoform X5 n=1 Tax=Corvus kubaryi TaxID=68294 RepID=UPI001C05330C|nr:myosin-14-like isoform X5 [Corvus kubaryi]
MSACACSRRQGSCCGRSWRLLVLPRRGQSSGHRRRSLSAWPEGWSWSSCGRRCGRPSIPGAGRSRSATTWLQRWATPPAPAPMLGTPGGLQAALEELREHNRGLREHLNQRLGQVEELRRALVAAGMRAREAQGAWARLAQEQRLLRERLQHPRDPPAPPEPALRARCAHLQELLQREAGARVALSRAARVTSRRLRVLVAEAEEQRLLGERYRLQARASEAAGRLLADQVAAVAAGTAQALAQGHHLRRELEDVGDGAAATARHVAVLRTRLRCDPMNLSRTVRRMLRDGDDDSEDSGDSEDGGTPPATPLKPAPGAWGGARPSPQHWGNPLNPPGPQSPPRAPPLVGGFWRGCFLLGGGSPTH